MKCKVFRRKLSFLFIKTWPEETRNNIKVKTPLSASSACAMNVQQQNLNTVKSLLRQFFVKRSLRKLNQITKKKSRFSNIIEWKTPSDHWRGGSKWVGEGRVVTVRMWNKCLVSFTFSVNSKCCCFFSIIGGKKVWNTRSCGLPNFKKGTDSI